MKRLLILTAVFVLSLPATADEKKSGKRATTDESASEKAAPVESPLVAAARKAKRGTSKSVVITEETLKKSTGHLTSTTIVYMPDVSKPSLPSSDIVANEARAKVKADAAKKAADEKELAKKKETEAGRLARLAEESEQGEEGLGTDVDPAQLERDLAENAAKQQQGKKP